MLERDLLGMSTDITPSSHEALSGGSIGEAIIVVHFDTRLNGDNAMNPKIATGRVIKVKESSGRWVGQRDIFIETRKQGENRLWNVWGGLGEFTNDDTLPAIREHLFFVEGGMGQTSTDGKHVGLSVLVYDGPRDIEFHPTSDEEVAFNGWMSVGEFLGEGNVRDLARQFLDDAGKEGLITKAVNNYSSPELRSLVFPPGFSIEAFNREREKLEDVKFTLPTRPRIA